MAADGVYDSCISPGADRPAEIEADANALLGRPCTKSE